MRKKQISTKFNCPLCPFPCSPLCQKSAILFAPGVGDSRSGVVCCFPRRRATMESGPGRAHTLSLFLLLFNSLWGTKEEEEEVVEEEEGEEERREG